MKSTLRNHTIHIDEDGDLGFYRLAGFHSFNAVWREIKDDPDSIRELVTALTKVKRACIEWEENLKEMGVSI